MSGPRPVAYIKKLSTEGKGTVDELNRRWADAEEIADKEGFTGDPKHTLSLFRKMVRANVTSIGASTRLYHHLIKAGRETGEGAGALFYAESTGRFLLCQRADQGDAAGTWCGLGGGRDRQRDGTFEDLEHTVRREAYEEAAIPIDEPYELHCIGTSVADDGFKFTNYLGVMPNEITPVLNDEHTDYMWVNWEDFPDNMHPQMMKAFAHKLGRLMLRRNTSVTDEQLHQLARNFSQ